MEYTHTQKAPLGYLLEGLALVFFFSAWYSSELPVVWAVLVGAARSRRV